MSDCDAAIAGGGFCGLMVLYHLVRTAPAGARFVIFEPSAWLGRGLAYSTLNTRHLLNVRACNVSALPDQPGHFTSWLKSGEGKAASKNLGLNQNWQDNDYVPRALYALYLDALAETAFKMAKDKGISVEHKRTLLRNILAADSGFLLEDEDGSKVCAKNCVLALGNLIAQDAVHSLIVQDVWGFDFSKAHEYTGPVVIIGTGLTMVDMVIALRDGGYKGVITAVSRHGKLPHIHEQAGRDEDYGSYVNVLARSAHPLPQLIMQFRKEAEICAAKGLSWQRVYDCWRPYTKKLWEGMNLRDKKKFFSRLFSLWNIHRHRMAPKVGRFIEDQMKSGNLKIFGGGAKMKTAADHVEIRMGKDTIRAALVLDCRGPSYDITKSYNGLLHRLLKNGLIAPHETDVGLAVEPDLRISGENSLYALGSLAMGARLESVAVPELRVQAQEIAQAITGRLSPGNP